MSKRRIAALVALLVAPLTLALATLVRVANLMVKPLARVSPAAAVPLRGLAALVAYSRVHTGAHYPGDIAAGSLIGAAIGELTAHALDPLL